LYLELLEPDARKLAPEQLAWLQLQRLAATLGGLNMYLQKGTSVLLSPRNRQMCAEFRGDYKALARKYKLTEQQVRNIVDEWQRQEYAKRQTPLFAEPVAPVAPVAQTECKMVGKKRRTGRS
jgi:Mor family transcriptional regulator